MPKNREEELSEVPELIPENFWRADNVGDEISGVLTRKGQGQFGEFFVLIQDSDGTEIGLPTNVNLNGKLETLKVGTWVRIRYTKEIGTRKGWTCKIFQVKFKPV